MRSPDDNKAIKSVFEYLTNYSEQFDVEYKTEHTKFTINGTQYYYDKKNGFHTIEKTGKKKTQTTVIIISTPNEILTEIRNAIYEFDIGTDTENAFYSEEHKTSAPTARSTQIYASNHTSQNDNGISQTIKISGRPDTERGNAQARHIYSFALYKQVLYQIVNNSSPENLANNLKDIVEKYVVSNKLKQKFNQKLDKILDEEKAFQISKSQRDAILMVDKYSSDLLEELNSLGIIPKELKSRYNAYTQAKAERDLTPAQLRDIVKRASYRPHTLNEIVSLTIATLNKDKKITFKSDEKAPQKHEEAAKTFFHGFKTSLDKAIKEDTKSKKKSSTENVKTALRSAADHMRELIDCPASVMCNIKGQSKKSTKAQAIANFEILMLKHISLICDAFTDVKTAFLQYDTIQEFTITKFIQDIVTNEGWNQIIPDPKKFYDDRKTQFTQAIEGKLLFNQHLDFADKVKPKTTETSQGIGK